MKNFANTYSLDGIWQFAFVPRSLTTGEIFATPLTEITMVPGCFDADPALFGKRGTGIYQREITCSGRIMLDFQAIGLRARVYWDGVLLDTIPWAFNPHRILIDTSNREAVHTLTVAVENIFDMADDSMFRTYYDFYGFGGIYRSVTLRKLADTVWVDRVQVTPLSVEKATADVAVFLGGAAESRDVKIYIDDVLCGEMAVTGSGSMVCTIPAPAAPWTPETPVLHKIRICTASDFLETAFGLRTLSWNDGTLKLNGSPLKLIGYCRHDSHPDYGYAMPENRVLSDLKLIKNQGSNFIRGSHYKQSEFLLDCCDRMGLLVWDESCGWNNKESHCANESFIRKQVAQSVLMVQEAYNHPSVIMWGCMNEISSDTEPGRNVLAKIFDGMRAADSSRPVTFASNRPDKDISFDLPDIISTNIYPGWYDEELSFDNIDKVLPRLEEVAANLSREEYRSKPWIISEIGAASIMGCHNGGRWSEEYQARLIRAVLTYVQASPRCTGTALWQFANANTYMENISLYSRPRGFNNKGLLTEHREPKLAWIAATELLKKK